jgi:hypothetical protein
MNACFAPDMNSEHEGDLLSVTALNLHDMPLNVLRYIFAFIGSRHYLYYIAQTCNMFLQQYREVWLGNYMLIRVAAASIECLQLAIKWNTNFDSVLAIAFLISGAV